EIIQRKTDAARFQSAHLSADIVDIGHQQALGQLQFESMWVGVGASERGQYLIDKVGLMKLVGADVNGNGEMSISRLFGPACALRTGSVEYPPPQRHDQTGLLGKGNKFCGRHQATFRMLP